MTDKPILFSAPMIRALLAGAKTQTRRVLEPQPDYRGPAGCMDDYEEWGWEDEDGYHVSVLECWPNRFSKGDRLWVRESLNLGDPEYPIGHATYVADGHDVDLTPKAAASWASGYKRKTVPPIHMPRWASRLTLIVTDVRVQRVQDISNDDAIAEGIEPHGHAFTGYGKSADLWMAPYDSFASLWDSINDHRGYGWAANPWVVALTFTVHQRNIDQMEDAHDPS